MDLNMDWDSVLAEDVHEAADSIPDGLIRSLNDKGCVDISYIAAISGSDEQTVIDSLKGSIYQNPARWQEDYTRGWETADEYLSGNIRQKLELAEHSNKQYNGYFSANVEALNRVFPGGILVKNIYITLGSPWIPVDVIRDFVKYVQDDPDEFYADYDVRHDEMTGTWEFAGPIKWHNTYHARERYGTPRRKPLDILLRTLNMQSVAVYDTKKSAHTKSGKVAVLNKEETVLALEKQKLLIEDFQQWVWTDIDRARTLKDIYETRFLSVKQRQFDGSFLQFPGMNEHMQLYPYQKNAVARILFTPNTLLAHDVGSGKTYIMIAAGMELHRLGQSKKNLYVVPNNIVGQWCEIFQMMYPDANVLCVESKDFTPAKRQGTLQKIRDGEYDGIVMAYSCFSLIPISIDCQIELLNQELKQLEEIQGSEKKNTGRIRNKIEKLREKRAELAVTAEQELICFDELGISRLFVDEAHNFKNVPIDTKIDRVMGISTAGSKKCKDMMNKVRIVQKQNGGKGVVLATGTPITNSITDAYIMQSYLQSGELALLEIQNFDSWVGMFAERATNFEIDVDTSTYRLATRFSKFHNIPELTTMLASFADFHQVEDSAEIPKHDGYLDMVIPKTAGFAEYLKQISKRADTVRNGRISRTEDNMLKITTDGRLAALDLRLVDEKSGFTTHSKVFRCAENVADVYERTKDKRSTQLVFCDNSTPKERFNIYDELKGLLVKMGVKEEEIAYIHDAATEAKREKLFAAMRDGSIRVLIGSTFKLGLGVNVQDKLAALHHLDVPWRPADMVQREGRILRQGNENKKVELYRYITEGSFDAYSWQLLETKQRFIADLLSGSITQRDGSDIDDTVLNYAEVKAIAIGNPKIKERVEVANELAKYQILQKKLVAKRVQYEAELADMPEKIARLKILIPLCRDDMQYYKEHKQEYETDDRRDIRQTIFAATHTEEPTNQQQELMEYQGFRVVVPAKTSKHHPVVKLCRSGEYSVELTVSELGSMGRIDRCLDELEDRHTKLSERLEELEKETAYMQAELQQEEDYIYDIEWCKDRIRMINEELGVDENE